jgi:hypothetical protein
MVIKDLHPSGLDPGSLAAQALDMMMKGGLGLPALAACADLVSSDCRFCEWSAVDVKESALDEDGWLALLDEYDRICEMAKSAFVTFHVGGSQERLCADLAEVIERLNHRPALPKHG